MARKTSFSYSFLVLPAEQRRAIEAVFDFCRIVDDSVDLEADQRLARQAVSGWREEVVRIFESGLPETPEGRQLQPFVRPFQLPRDQFDALVDGVEMDVTPRRYQTFSDLEPYCHRVASSVGLMCAAIFGCHDLQSQTYARDLGVALQLTNILRDVGVDFRNGRCYVPQEDFRQFGCDEDDIQRELDRRAPDRLSDRMQALLEHQALRARTFFERASRALPSSEIKRFVAAEIMHAIYRDLLRRIEAAQYDVFPALIRVPKPIQARLAIGAWWRARRA